jgi:serine/threonine-protein kinase
MVIGGNFTLVGRIGSGAMGEVWRAEDGRLRGRHVAVKILRPELLSDKTFPARFRREAEVLSTLSHANVVKVFDYGEGQPGEDEAEARPAYIVMELIDGRPLDEVVEENGGTLPTERVLALLADALEGLHEAHQHEVVHRDIKPANLMLRTDGRVMVTDFGIARATAGTKLTDSHSVVGTSLYMAPEQVAGAVEPSCDLYAVGVVCYQLLTGALPFTGDSPLVVMNKHVSEPPPELPGTFPEPVRAFVARALAKRPGDRFADAAEMAAAARRAAAGTPLPGDALPPPVPAPPPEPPKGKRRRWPAMLLLPVVFVVYSGGTGLKLMPWQDQPGQTEAGDGDTPGGTSPPSAPEDEDGDQGSGDEPPEKGPPSPSEGLTSTEPNPSDGPSRDEQDSDGDGDDQQTGGDGDGSGSGGIDTDTTSGGASGGDGGTSTSGGSGGSSGGTSGGSGGGSGGGGDDGGPNPPPGCGGASWGHITSVADGRRIGLASDSPGEGVEVIMGGTTSLGWVRGEGSLPSWEAFHSCSASHPSLSGNENGLHLSSDGGPWVIEAASGGSSRIKLDGAGDLGCLTNSGGRTLTVAPCGSGDEYQMWHLPG